LDAIILCVALGSFVLGACGGSGLTPDASRALLTDVAEVRTATASGDRAIADVALAELRASVERLHANGAIDDDTAAEVLAAASGVESALALMPTTTTTAPPDDDDDDDDGPGKAKGHDSGKGKE
jgi:hypothetical protein